VETQWVGGESLETLRKAGKRQDDLAAEGKSWPPPKKKRQKGNFQRNLTKRIGRGEKRPGGGRLNEALGGGKRSRTGEEMDSSEEGRGRLIGPGKNAMSKTTKRN